MGDWQPDRWLVCYGTVACGTGGDIYVADASAALHSCITVTEALRFATHGKASTMLEIATAEYIDWSGHRRLHGETGPIPPAELDNNHHRHTPAPAIAEA